MKNTYFVSLITVLSFFTLTAQAAKTLNLDVADQNFNSTDKIVIEHEEIQKSRANNLPTLLATKANISISTTNMQPNSVYIRGGDSSHVLILVDGVPTYDASTIQRTVNLFGVNLSKIKRIEVLKGSQSVIYGGQALSGVIKIETFSEDNKNGTSVIADAAAGKFNSSKQTLSVDTLQNTTDNIVFTAGAYGLNAKNTSPSLGSDHLYPQQTGAADLGVLLKGDLENIFKVNYSKDFNQITNSDAATYKPVDANDFRATTEMIGGTWILRKNDLFTFSVTHQKANRNFDQSAANTGGAATDYDYEGLLTNARLDAYLLKSETVNLMAGVQYSEESLSSSIDGGLTVEDYKAQYEGLYLKSDFLLPQDFLFEYGVRQENAKGRSLASSYHVGLIWNKMVKVQYSTGFRTPSLFQLYTSYGNPNLKPETSKDFSITFEHKFGDQFYTALTYFDTQFENLVEYSPALMKFDNVAKTRTVGVESQTNANFFEGQLRLSLGLGYQEPRDLSKDVWLSRRALRTASLKVSSDLTQDLNVGAEFVHTGEKRDRAGATLYVMTNDYTLINLFGNYRLSESTSVFARVDNLENKDYEASYSYYTQGALYKVGAQVNF